MKHAFTNPIGDRAGYSGTKPSHWNAEHVATGTVNSSVTGTYNLDASAGDRWILTLTGNTTLTVSNSTLHQEITVVLIQDSTGGRSVAWPSSFKGGMEITTTIADASAASAICVQKFLCYDGTNWAAVAPGTVN